MKPTPAILITLLFHLLLPASPPEAVTESAMLFAVPPGAENRIVLPLERTDVSLEVTGLINTATVTQTFVNHTPHTLEAVYTFPLPANAAVTDMELRCKDRRIRSLIQEKEQAKETYTAAKQQGKKTAILDEQRPNIFTTSVANFAPGERVSIRIQYMETLPYQSGQVSLTFPMVVGQRYLPANWQQQEDGSFARMPPNEEQHSLNPPVLPRSFPEQATLYLNAQIQGLPLADLTSNTHRLYITPPRTGDDPTQVTLDPEGVVPHAEFNLTLHLKQEEAPLVSFVESTTPDQRYGLLTLFPPTTETDATPPPPRDVVFVIDTSGSMAGESIGQAKQGLLRCLDMLRPEDRFTVIRFSSDFSFFAPDFRYADPEKLQQAKGYISQLEAEGGTEMHPALRHALSLRGQPGHLKLVIFLTDGDVGNEDELLRLLKAELGRARMFTFAIGSAPNEFLIRTMAEQGRGQARFIRSHEDIGQEMADFFQTLEAPVLTDISLAWMDTQGMPLQVSGTYPSPCPDVFRQRPVQVVVSSRDSLEGAVQIQGKINGETVTFTTPIRPQTTSHPAIESLYGREILHKLMLDYMQAENPVVREEVRESIVETAVKYQLVSKFTSRVAVEETVTTAPDGSRKTVQVPVPLPRGWTGGFTATATLHPVLMLIGGQLLLMTCLLHYIRRRVIQ